VDSIGEDHDKREVRCIIKAHRLEVRIEIMKVFISYSPEDEALALAVADTLEEAGLEAWIDKHEVVPGENWAERIGQGLRDSSAMVVLLTPGALKSQRVRWDIDYALSHKAYSHRLIPVIVGSAEDFKEEAVPWILKRLDVINIPAGGVKREGLRRIAQALRSVA
jgi:hypothetical protein